MSLCSRGSEVLTDYIRGSRLHAPKVMEWGSELDLLRLLPLHHHRAARRLLRKNPNSGASAPVAGGSGWGRGGTHCPLLSPQPWALLAHSPMGDRQERKGGRYLQLCRGRSLSPAVGWLHLCNSPLRSPGWQGRTDRRQVLGCWPPGSLRAARGWSLPGKRARQNSVEHCSYSGLVCRE